MWACPTERQDRMVPVGLQQRGWIPEWYVSDHNRKAKFYTIAAYWARLAGVIGRVLAIQSEGAEE